MHKTNLFRLGILLAVLATAALGCNREPALVEPPPFEVMISQPVSEKIADWDLYTGTLDAKESVDIRSRVRGHIKEVRFQEGEEIAAGADLFIIDSTPFEADLKQAKGQLATWEAKLKFADEKMPAYKKLAETGAGSKEEYLKVITDKSEAIGGIDVSRGKIIAAELNIGFCKITAPISGRVGEAMLTTGNLVNSSGADSLLTTIVGVDPIYVNFYVNERAYENYRKLLRQIAEKDPAAPKGTKLKIPVEMSIDSDGRFPYKGFVDFVDNRVDSATGSIKVRAKFDNPVGADGRRPLTVGKFARLRITLADPYQATLVADRAILSDQSLKYVLVVNKEKNNTVERVDILAANRVQEDGLRVIQSGLNGKEWIIVEGVNRARPGATVKPTETAMPRQALPGK